MERDYRAWLRLLPVTRTSAPCNDDLSAGAPSAVMADTRCNAAGTGMMNLYPRMEDWKLLAECGQG
jgi:hypothetical protein